MYSEEFLDYFERHCELGELSTRKRLVVDLKSIFCVIKMREGVRKSYIAGLVGKDNATVHHYIKRFEVEIETNIDFMRFAFSVLKYEFNKNKLDSESIRYLQGKIIKSIVKYRENRKSRKSRNMDLVNEKNAVKVNVFFALSMWMESLSVDIGWEEVSEIARDLRSEVAKSSSNVAVEFGDWADEVEFNLSGIIKNLDSKDKVVVLANAVLLFAKKIEDSFIMHDARFVFYKKDEIEKLKDVVRGIDYNERALMLLVRELKKFSNK